MNFIGCFTLFLLMNICTVFGRVMVTNDGYLKYILRTENNSASITGVANKNVKSVTIKSTITYNKTTFDVVEISEGTFSGSNVETVIIDNSFKSDFYIRAGAFLDANHVKKIVVNSCRASSEIDSFYGLPDDVVIEGDGIMNFGSQYFAHLRDLYGFEYKRYEEMKDNGETMKRDLFKLAKIVNKEFILDNSIPNGDNALVVLALGKGSSIGIARVFKSLTQYIGVPYDDCKAVSYKKYGWNIININNKWYNIDVAASSFPNNLSYDPSIFYSSNYNFHNKYIKSTYNTYSPNEWIVHHDIFGYNGDAVFNSPNEENLNQWLAKYAKGEGHVYLYKCD